MTTYKNIHGKRVKTFATDLDNAEAEGQIFFSEAAIGREFKTVVASSAWSSSASMSQAKAYIGDAGIQTAALGFGGYLGPFTNTTEEYNGSGWGSGGNLNTGRQLMAGFGTQTAAVGAGGDTSPGPQANVEHYDGSSWTNATAVPAATGGAGATGT